MLIARTIYYLISFSLSTSLLWPTRSLANDNTIRIATFNLWDVQAKDLQSGSDPRLKKAAAMIQSVQPDIILLNEIAYDQNNNGQRFADGFLAKSQGINLKPISYRSLATPSNTGVHSGFDFDNNGKIVSDPYINPREYGNDAWGFGEFPGHYALAVLVRKDLKILESQVRSFQKFLWKDLPGAMKPVDPKTGKSWYNAEEWLQFRLSSKTHLDVPVQLGDDTILHVLASHPTPPVFDGEEDRNGARNHDEIRFWAEYINGQRFITDDAGRRGGLPENAAFVILGDLNADPNDGDSIGNPMKRWLLSHPRILDYKPKLARYHDRTRFGYADDDDDTASWALRVDYVLPSDNFLVNQGAVEWDASVSDHGLVWLEITVK
ncbi:endonuclease/exonuclease/phosphatase family protein [Pseudobacteriovorax antillogorgiicola]|uniref:Endonuclease/Exonuclease/phosphatase family protein n=1 Tax=Pseudobacteriovorax antillogorgiicola TaxID=1513793 RepID=A0A1Y6CCS5_9BACT|nr:endonuclease/exonuclease/phosphatase family protein [Pseudobacteriovorax antillogorgiicola]TCS48258.1 endonuclease/exonuclease/phosphatase family protein [Pseudobacteriovorax antillogorgiicola]SMF57184.1 Endonuclease/Exonuclease/phosphatase family protein [Pseudobacteriovorax antillogorgiicola]